MRFPISPSRVLVLLLAAEFALLGQYPPRTYPPAGSPPGGYPPGTYPPGGYPDGVGLPIPGRGKQKKKTTPKEDKNRPSLQNVAGLLRQLDEKSVVIEAQDTRIIDLKRSAETKFYKNRQEIPADALKPGDHLMIEARQDDDSYLYAVNVNLQKEGSAAEQAEASQPVQVSSQARDSDDERPILRRKDSPPQPVRETAPAANAPAASATGPVPVPAAGSEPPPVEDTPELDRIHHDPAPQVPFDDSDPGPPRLKRGKPAPRKPSTRPAEVAVNTPAPARRDSPPVSSVPAPSEEDRPAFPPVSHADAAIDARIEKARMVAAGFLESLPNYFCQEQMARFLTTTHVVDWRPLDVVSVDVIYEHGRESYRNLAINGKPVKKNINELSGAWSTGEFGSALADLFSPATAAEFRARGDSRSAGRAAFLYDFEVDHEHSHWRVNAPSQSVSPAYRGSVWIDKETGRLLRIEMQARQLPQAFPLDKVEMATDYEYVRIADGQFLLPVHSETLGCQRGTNICSRNVIDFRNYHKYSGESTITFEK